MSNPKPRLLIVGGGFAGASLAKRVSSAYDVTLVDRRAYFEVTFATVRSTLDSKTLERSVIAFSDIPGIGKFVQGNVVSLSSTTCTLEGGSQLAFDYCVIATGSSYSSPLYKSNTSVTRDDRLREMEGYSAQIKAARNITIVGGGATGVEAAAEVVEAYAGKQVTLVTSAERILPTMPLRPSSYAHQWLVKHGVRVIVGEKATAGEDNLTLVLSNKEQLRSDLIITTTGQVVHTDYLKTTDLARVCNQWGSIKVDQYLQVPGFPHIYAIGDCNDVPEAKKGYLAGLQAEVVASNLLKLMKNSKATLKAYKPNGGNPDTMAVSLGRHEGVGNMGSCTCIGRFPVGMLKAKDLFVGKTRDMFGLKA